MRDPKRICLVLGVYRSGTSAIMKGLETLGMPLMDLSATFYDEFNEKGYWEDLDVHGFNRSLLKALEPLEYRRRSLLPLTEQEIHFLCQQGFLTKASELLFKKLSAAAPLALKDPKFSILLPFWKAVFSACDVQASFIIALRNPFNVTASIAASHQVLGAPQPQEKSYWMWISFLLSCLEHTEGYECLLVDYDLLLNDPVPQIARIARCLRRTADPTLLKTYCDDFLDVSLRHFKENNSAIYSNTFSSTLSLEIYEKLLAVAQDHTAIHELKGSFKKWKEAFLAAESLLILAEKNEYTIQSRQDVIQEREQVLQELQKTINKNSFSIAGYCQTIHQRDLQLASLLQKQAKRNHEILHLRHLQ